MGATVRIGHSPDPDDAFMFYGLTFKKFKTAPERYTHRLLDIETLNRLARTGRFEVTALSFHAYAYVADRYLLLPQGASFGDGYGPLLVARAGASGKPRAWLEGRRIAVPGRLTSAVLALRLFAGKTRYREIELPFDQIIPAVAAGRCDGGLLIHEGQLTFHEPAQGGLTKIVDLGAWWKEETGLPLPLGANAIRRDLGPRRLKRIAGHIRRSIAYGLAHRAAALEYARRWSRGLDAARTDRFVALYVNRLTLAYGRRGRQAVQTFFERARARGLLPRTAALEFAPG